MVLVLALASNIFGAVPARLGAADWITDTLLALPLPGTLMLALVIVLIFLLGWPFEWPAVIPVFLPIFYPVVKGLGIDLVWFSALVAVTLQTGADAAQPGRRKSESGRSARKAPGSALLCTASFLQRSQQVVLAAAVRRRFRCRELWFGPP